MIHNAPYKIIPCTSFGKRLKGRMFQVKKNTDGYLFPKCHSIHTFFCFQNFDIVVLDHNGCIVSIHQNQKPWHFYFYKGNSIIEFCSGYLPPLTIGDQLIKDI